MDNELNINAQTPTNRPGHKMSSSLKKKLQKLGRYHGSRIPPKIQRKTLAWSSPSPTCSSPLMDRSSTMDTNTTRSTDNSPNVSLEDVPNSPELTAGGTETPKKRRNLDSGAPDIKSILSRCTEENKPTIDVKIKLETSLLSKEKENSLDDQSLSVENEDGVNLRRKLSIWENKVKEKEELLRKLKMVKLYRTKNDLEGLNKLIVHWRTACQNALMEYREKLGQDPAPSMTDIINHMKIDCRLIRYNPEDQGFID